MSKPKLFRTAWTFDNAAEAVAFFNAERAETVDAIPDAVLNFLASIKDYDPDVVYNVQPSLKTHYVAVAHPDDHHAWLYAKPGGVTFLVEDERNVDAVHDMWGTSEVEPPSRSMPTDVWFPPSELTGTAAAFCLRLAAAWAESIR